MDSRISVRSIPIESIKFLMVVTSKTLLFLILRSNFLNSYEFMRVSKCSIEFSRVSEFLGVNLKL